MANWEHIYDLTGPVDTWGKVATDGTSIYYWDTSVGMYRYNPSSNTDELLITDAAFEAEAQSHIPGQAILTTEYGNISVFNQTLYVGIWYQYQFDIPTSHGRFVIFKVVGATVTQVAFIDKATEVAGGAFSLFADSELIVYYYDDECQKSTNGTSWSDIAQPIFDSGAGLPEAITYPRDFRDIGIYTGAQGDVYYFNGTQWELKGNLNGSIASTLMDGKDIYWITRHDANEFTDDDFATYDLPATDQSLFAAIQLNMPYPVAHKPNDFDSSFSEVYWFDGLDWQLLDTTDVGPPFWSTPTGGQLTSKAWIIRIDSGEVYALVRSGAAWDVWKRDTNLAPTPDAWGGPCEPATFYYGVDALIERGTLPFCSVNPGAMAITELFVAVVGNADPATSNSEAAYAVYPYDIFADMTPDIANEAVVSVKNV